MDHIRGLPSLLVILTILVLAHELGHYTAARLLKLRVDEFSIFFGPKIMKLFTFGDTAFIVRSVPLGGFVKIAGMDVDGLAGGHRLLETLRRTNVTDTDQLARFVNLVQVPADSVIDSERVSMRVKQALSAIVWHSGIPTEQSLSALETLRGADDLTIDDRRLLRIVCEAVEPARSGEGYNDRPIWHRVAVIAAGPVASLLFGLFVFCSLGVTFGVPGPKVSNQVTVVSTGDMPAFKAGIHSGDYIVSIDGIRTTDPKVITDTLHASAGKHLTIGLLRGGQPLQIRVTPMRDPVLHQGRIGVELNPLFVRTSLIRSLTIGVRLTILYFQTVVEAITGGHGREAIGGPIRIGQMANVTQRLGIQSQLMLMASFSLSLGAVNLLPIPILDGGHLLLLLLEKVRKRRFLPSEIYKAQAVGLAVILLLFSFVMYNDIASTIAGHAIQ